MGKETRQTVWRNFKGCKLHHVEAARRALEAHRFDRTRSIKIDGVDRDFGEGSENASAGIAEVWNSQDHHGS